MTVLSGLLTWAEEIAVLGCGLAVVGFFLAPSLVTGYLLSDHLTEAGVRTEASNWINTAVNAGAAVAAGALGVVVDSNDPRWGFGVGAIVALVFMSIAAVMLVSGQRKFSSRRSRVK